MQPESTSLRPHYAIARELGVSEQRMIAQYAIASARDCLVIGTDQAAEALMGFFTKHGDGAADVLPLRALPPGPAP